MHRQGWKRSRGPSGSGQPLELLGGYVAFVEVSGIKKYLDRSDPFGCWPWRGRLNKGYGSTFFTVFGKRTTTSAHRAVWQATHGLIIERLEVDHLCRNRACCNPYHLELVTREENRRRALPYRVNKGVQKIENCKTLGHIIKKGRGLEYCACCASDVVHRRANRDIDWALDNLDELLTEYTCNQNAIA